MMQDLYARIVQSYKAAPELRMTWLENLAKFNEDVRAVPSHAPVLACLTESCPVRAQHQHPTEAAFARMHMVAMLCVVAAPCVLCPCPDGPCRRHRYEFLQLTHGRTTPRITVVREVLSGMSLQLEDDMNIEHTPVRPARPRGSTALTCLQDLDHVFQSKIFTEKSLTEQLVRTIGLFKDAAMFEHANEVYKLLVPLYESHHGYALLAAAHLDLGAMYRTVEAGVRARSLCGARG
jgi:hypothetical protein